jgi:hypothetical protein
MGGENRNPPYSTERKGGENTGARTILEKLGATQKRRK